MKHLGNITEISGYTAPAVDCIVGGSPCQDLSIAGKRAGLDGERSGLFMEQIRIVKEMRDRDVRDNGRSGVDVRPRHLVWENVPGALSSGKPKREDFRIVLEEIARIKDKDAVIPRPKKGKWSKSGCILGDGWSIAWRVHDAQFWGVPQRRRRIALVADFGGESAPEILFVRKSLSGNTQSSKPYEKEASSDATRGTGAEFRAIGCDVYNMTLTGDKVCALTAQGYTSTGTCPKVIQPVYAIDQGGGKSQCNITEGQSPTLTCTHGGEPVVCYNNGVNVRSILRRLTPLECERLQGYPDGWTDIGEWTDSNGKTKKSSDTARYKALGNSIALPPWKWVMKRLCACYERDATLASLFDGIGGFPYIWEQINGKGSCLWASEIEEFPMAVTKVRIGE